MKHALLVLIGLAQASYPVTTGKAYKFEAVAPGVYYAQLSSADGRVGYAPFIIHPTVYDEHRVAVVLPVSTWQAYNNWDGSGQGKTFVQGTGTSLYVYGGNNSALLSTGRATKVSYNRPLIVDATTGGLGDYNSPLHAEYPMVRWLEQNGRSSIRGNGFPPGLRVPSTRRCVPIHHREAAGMARPAGAIERALTPTGATGTKLSALPEKVQRTIQSTAPGAPIADISRHEKDGRVIYEVAFKDKGKNPTIQVADDGSLVQDLQK